MSRKRLLQVLCFLHDPALVTRFQQNFGLQILEDESEHEKYYKTNRQIHVGETRDVVTQKFISSKYCINSYFWYYLFSFGSKLGYELFYAFSFSYTYWNLDSMLCRKLMLVWATLMYIGQALKDIIRWPRPAGDQVLILEPKYAIEFGMPSTHAMLGLMVPLTVYSIIDQRYEFSTPIFLLVASFWCLLICCSRLYLGMHSVLDILAGLSLTATLLLFLLPSLSLLDHYLIRHWSSPLVLYTSIILLALFYPKCNDLSPSRADTCVMISSFGGIYLGSWLNFQLGMIRPGGELLMPYTINIPEMHQLPELLVRTVLGLLLVVVFRAVGKQVGKWLSQLLSSVDISQEGNKHLTVVEVPSKVCTYTTVGFTISFVAPLLLRWLHLSRQSMYFEA